MTAKIVFGIVGSIIGALLILNAEYGIVYEFQSHLEVGLFGAVEQLAEIHEYFWLYLPIGVIGLWRWSSWVFKKIQAKRYKPFLPTNNIQTVSIITPVYNEDPDVFSRALESWHKNSPDEIIAVIDEKESRCIQVFKKFASDKPAARLVVTSKPGKRNSLSEGIRLAKSEIVALVDSDTVWETGTKINALAPFSNQKIGGVCTRQNVMECGSIWQRVTDIFWDTRNHDDLPAQAANGGKLSCLSGRTAFYRKSLILPKLDLFLNEVLFGRKKESGDDKFLTRMIQMEGYQTYYQNTAQIYSSAVSNFRAFLRQRIRWTRNSFNSDLASMRDGWVWKDHYLAFSMIDRFITAFTVLISPIMLGIALYLNHWLVVVSILLLWTVGRGIKIMPHLKRKPADIVILPIYTFVNFIIAITKIYSLITLRDQRVIRGDNSPGGLHNALAITATGAVCCSLVFAVVFFVMIF